MSIVIREDNTPEQYAELYAMPVGGIIEIVGDYETVLRRITDNIPAGKRFEVFPINAGTPLFVMYGCNHLIITVNEEI